MSLRYGKCINFGLCTVADSRKPVELPDTEVFVCPECEKPLEPIEGKGPGRSAGPSKKGIWVAALALLMVVGGVLYLVFGPGPDHDKSNEKNPSAGDSSTVITAKDDHVILRLHGSNTIGSDLAPELARGYLLKNGSKSVTIDAGSKPNQRFVTGHAEGKSAQQSIEVYAPGSGVGFTDLAAGATDIAMLSRRVKGDERRLLERLGDMESPGCEHVVGLDGVAVIVNQNNPVTQLSIAQLRDIFSGRTVDWSGAGGRGGGIHLYARDDKSGTFETIKALVLDPLPLAANAKRFADSKELSDGVAADPQGIGFIGLPFVGNNRAVLVNSAGARPLAPTFFTVAREDYPLSRRLYFYTAAAPTNATVNGFIEFALSPAGQDVVKKVGFASQNIEAEPSSAQDQEFYRDAIRGAMKLNLVFRFRKGKAELDNKARRDLERLIDYERAQNPPQQILLFGYADSTGTPGQNLDLSRVRARAVAGELASRGLPAARVDGFGQANPVADNSTEDGQEMNRRVDVWIRR